MPQTIDHSAEYPFDWMKPFERASQAALRKLKTVPSDQIITEEQVQAVYQKGLADIRKFVGARISQMD